MVFKKGNTYWKNRKSEWNKGLTKETDKRLMDTSKKISETRKELFEKGILKSPKEKLNKKQKEEVKRLFKKGFSRKELKEKYNVSDSLIYSIIKEVRENNRELDLRKFNENLKKLKDFDKGYIVGFLDGEGSIIIHKCTTKKKEQKTYYTGMINFSNQEEEIIKYLHKKLGLKTKIVKSSGDCYQANLYGKKFMKSFLKFILPYVKSKKTLERGKILMEFCDLNKSKEQKNLYNKIKKTNSLNLR